MQEPRHRHSGMFTVSGVTDIERFFARLVDVAEEEGFTSRLKTAPSDLEKGPLHKIQFGSSRLNK